MSGKRCIGPHAHDGLTLRLLTEQDLPLTLAWRNDDDSRVWFKNPEKLGPAQHAAWFSSYSTKDDDFVFMVESHGVAVGQASVYGIDRAAGSAEVGRFLAAPGEKGKGFIFRACGALLDVCRHELALRHVFLEVFAGNHRAIRIYEGHGFRATTQTSGLLRMEKDLTEIP